MSDKQFVKVSLLNEAKKQNAYFYIAVKFDSLKRDIETYFNLVDPRIFWIDEEGDEIDINNQCNYEIFMLKSTTRWHLLATPNPDVKKDQVPQTPVTNPTTQLAIAPVSILTLDNEESIALAGSVVHDYVSCDSCQMAPIVGFRYKCVQCPDYDLCESCESMHKHPQHMMVRMPDDKCNKVVEASTAASVAAKAAHDAITNAAKTSVQATYEATARAAEVAVKATYKATNLVAETAVKATQKAAAKAAEAAIRAAYNSAAGGDDCIISLPFDEMNDIKMKCFEGGHEEYTEQLELENTGNDDLDSTCETVLKRAYAATYKTAQVAVQATHDVTSQAAYAAMKAAHEATFKTAEAVAKAAHDAAMEATKSFDIYPKNVNAKTPKIEPKSNEEIKEETSTNKDIITTITTNTSDESESDNICSTPPCTPSNRFANMHVIIKEEQTSSSDSVEETHKGKKFVPIFTITKTSTKPTDYTH